MGAQIDGYISMVAHSLVVGAAQVTDRKADVILAAHYAAEVVHRLLRPGKKNSQVTEAINKVAAEFKVSPVEGTKFDDHYHGNCDSRMISIPNFAQMSNS